MPQVFLKVLLLLWSLEAAAQLKTEISINSQKKVEIRASSGPTNGAVLVFRSSTPVFSSQQPVYIHDLSQAPFRYEPLPDLEDAFFFLTLVEGTPANYVIDPPDGDGADSDSFGFAEIHAPGPYESGTPIILNIIGRSKAGTRFVPNLCFALELLDKNGNPPPFHYLISPSNLCLSSEEIETIIYLESEGDLSGVEIWLVGDETGVPAKKIGFKADKTAKCTVEPSVGFRYPVDAPPARLSGTFGEWPGHSSGKAHLHKGVDLAVGINTPVLAAKSGRVVFNSALPEGANNNGVDPLTHVRIPNTVAGVGGLVSIDHLDGTETRYLHILPDPLLSPGICVTQGQVIGKVGDFTPIKTHLHFEVFQHLDGFPSPVPVNPVDFLNGLTDGDTDPPIVDSVVFRSLNPASAPVAERNNPMILDGTNVFLEVVTFDQDKRGGDATGRLAPYRITFEPEGQEQVSLSFNRLDTVDAFFQRATGNAGIPLLAEVDLPLKAIRFPYWFKWDTQVYATDLRGPRKFTLTVSDKSNSSPPFEFRVGPQIQDKNNLPVAHTTNYPISIKWIAEPFPSAQQGAQGASDSLTLEISTENVRENKLALFANQKTNLQVTITTGQTVTINLSLPALEFVDAATRFKLKVRSNGFPGIGDECTIRALPIHHIEMVPFAPAVGPGRFLQLSAVAKDEENNIVPTKPSDFTWTPAVEPTIANVSQSGLLSGLRNGHTGISVIHGPSRKKHDTTAYVQSKWHMFIYTGFPTWGQAKLEFDGVIRTDKTGYEFDLDSGQTKTGRLTCASFLEISPDTKSVYYVRVDYFGCPLSGLYDCQEQLFWNVYTNTGPGTIIYNFTVRGP